MAGRKESSAPMRAKWREKMGLGTQHHLSIKSTWDALRTATIDEDTIGTQTEMFQRLT